MRSGKYMFNQKVDIVELLQYYSKNAALVAQLVSRQSVGREVSGSIPSASRRSAVGPTCEHQEKGWAPALDVSWIRRSSPISGHPWPLGGKNK